MKKLLLFSILSFLAGNMANGQVDSLRTLREDIAWYADILANAEDDGHRLKAKDHLQSSFDRFLSAPGSFSTSLDSIPWIKVLHGDGFRMVTWQVKGTGEMFTYGGFIQWPDKMIPLRDTRPFVNGSLRSFYTPSGWYGCLYYEIIPFESGNRTYYLLFGFHAENGILNTKLADVLDLTGPEPRFGLPVFTGKGEPQTRLMMTYADVSSAHMRYDPELKGVVHDHLEILPGVGPNGEALPVSDGSLEGWLLKKGEWMYEEEVYDIRSKEPPMLDDRKDRKEDKDILGRPRKE